MVVTAKDLITVHVDNIGDIFKFENIPISQQKKHIYVRLHFIPDYIQDETVKIQFLHAE